MGGNRVTIVSVHGTGDIAAEPDGPIDGDHWFQTRSKFMASLKQRLVGRGIEAEIIPQLWSGANGAMERERGARALVETIKRAARRNGGPVHVIGHSHGGNVANDAARMLNWSRAQRDPKIASITTVGTPFFSYACDRPGTLWRLVVRRHRCAQYPDDPRDHRFRERRGRQRHARPR